ncbi:PIN domain-containing protein [Fibrella sp. WM1]|uniref:PIN domain-containing protein n=1 Tax=Fibrella musci TaxID=3242485 RepID=UPI0035204A22
MIGSLGVVALLDACVLYPAPIRDLLLHLADANLYKPKWTDRIQEEWTRNLLLNRPDLTAKQLSQTTDAMNSAFPEATVHQYQNLINVLDLPDPDDRHVLAAAICGQAQLIVTANLKDFPADRLSLYAIDAQHPDVFIAQLIELDPEAVLQAFLAQVANLRNPPKAAHDVLRTLRKTGLITTANALALML